MGFFSDLGSIISSAASVIGSAVSAIGGRLAGTASTFLKVVSPWLGAAIQVIQIIGMVLDILKPGEDVEELGAKAMQADKKPEDFDSNDEYIDYLRNEIELDKEKFANATEAEKVARKVVGATIVIKGVEEKKGFEIPMEAWVAMAKLKLDDGKEIDAILNTFKSEKLKEFAEYVSGKLTAEKEIEIGDTLVDMYKNLEPGLSEDEIEKKVMNMEVGDAKQ